MRTIPSSELIINDDGSIFHLHLKPEQLADIGILVGDPGRCSHGSFLFRYAGVQTFPTVNSIP